MAHAEPVFLVHDDQSELLEHDVGLEQLVCADDNVHGAGGKPVEYLLLLGPGAEA